MATESVVRLAPGVTAVRAARVWTRDRLPGLEPGLAADIELAVSELVTNAICHGSGPVTVWLRREEEHLSVGVEDAGRGRPALRAPADNQPQGRGLRIVAQIASTWWVDPGADGGKTVWMRVIVPRVGYEKG